MTDFALPVSDDTFVVPVGSSLTFTFPWTLDDGSPADLTGWTVDMTDLGPALVGHARATWVDAQIGLIEVDVDALPGVLSREEGEHHFRVRITPPSGATDALTTFRAFVWFA